jgi:hypothetical protein
MDDLRLRERSVDSGKLDADKIAGSVDVQGMGVSGELSARLVT